MTSVPSLLWRPFFFNMMMMMMMMMMSVMPSSCSAAAASKEEQRKLPLVGSYSPIPVTDPMAIEAAEFSVATLWAERPGNQYSFLSSSSSSSSSSPRPSPQVIAASQQVVAGLNLQLDVLLVKKEEDGDGASCVGAFAVTVYNQFGDLSVTRWGDEYTCAEAYDRMANDDEDAA
jgi:hypothetical protein